MAELAQLELALVNAHKAGDTDAARRLAAIIRTVDRTKVVPGSDVPGTVVLTPETTLAQDVVGAGEAALATGTGMTGGMAGMVAGTLKGLAEQILSGEFGTQQAAQAVQKSAQQAAGALTYAPRTQAGKEITEKVGAVASLLPPVLPVAPALSASAASAGTAAEAAAARAAAAAKGAAANAFKAEAPGATAGTMASVGGAGVDAATLRQAKANELPVPVKLTEGQKTRDFAQQQFERETAKAPEMGERIRERFADQNRQLQQNLDAFIDATGAEAPDLRSIGVKVDSAVRGRAARDKAEIRTLYKDAEKAGEMQGPVDISSLADYLNQNRAGRTAAPILQTVADELAVQGFGAGSLAEGTLKVVGGTLKQAEEVRKSISKFAKATDPNDLRVASDMKAIIDKATEGAGGDKYKAARAARAKYARDYENISLVKNIIGQKRGSADRAIALEDVLNRSIISPAASLDEVRHLRRLLQTEGENGMQAWRELQGGTLKHIKDEATKNVARNERGDQIVSAAQLDRTIKNLDKNGKLDFVFGKQGAEQLRTINDVAKDVLVATPGTVNTSNTAATILAALDIAISGTAGVPAPVLSGIRLAAKSVKDRKTRARVKNALGD